MLPSAYIHNTYVMLKDSHNQLSAAKGIVKQLSHLSHITNLVCIAVVIFIIITVMIMTSYAPISSKIELSGATQPRD